MQTPDLQVYLILIVFQARLLLSCTREFFQSFRIRLQRCLQQTPVFLQFLLMYGLLTDRPFDPGKRFLLLLQPVKQRQILLLLPDPNRELLALCCIPLRLMVLFGDLLHLRLELCQRFLVPGQFFLLLPDLMDIPDQLVFLLDLLVQRFDLPIQLVQCSFILRTELPQHLQSLTDPSVESFFAEPAHFLRSGRVLRTHDAVHILADAPLQFAVFHPLLPDCVPESALQCLIQPCLEDLAEDIPPLLRSCQQKLLEIPLRDHRDLRELLPVQTDQICHRPCHLF